MLTHISNISYVPINNWVCLPVHTDPSPQTQPCSFPAQTRTKRYKLVWINPQIADQQPALGHLREVEEHFNPLVICTPGGGFQEPEPAGDQSELFAQVWGLVRSPNWNCSSPPASSAEAGRSTSRCAGQCAGWLWQQPGETPCGKSKFGFKRAFPLGPWGIESLKWGR